ncbi:hypothetical protein [Granulicella sp. S190]|uniref:hypothetical protein n=1 Tax=Granulicella sp. S190 TaxID=1747226 RepID=UPI00131D9330|nr:hypothetical protein [Granulicella sp. S190]
MAASAVTAAIAQTPQPQSPVTDALLSLPDAPGFSSSDAVTGESSSAEGLADYEHGFIPAPKLHVKLPTRRDMTILPGQIAPQLDSHDKVVLGLKESVTVFSVIGWATSAGYSHLTNGSPNYGTDKAAFGERLGGTALRNVSESIFSVSLFAPLLHEDPRYYKMGNGNNFFKRVVYAATRPIITKTDSGNSTVNLSLLSGNLFGAALTNAYYPQPNRGFSQTMQTFGTSVGGSAIGFVVTEFLDDALVAAHLKKAD